MSLGLKKRVRQEKPLEPCVIAHRPDYCKAREALADIAGLISQKDYENLKKLFVLAQIEAYNDGRDYGFRSKPTPQQIALW